MAPQFPKSAWRLALGGQWGGQDDAQSVAALHRALDLGVNLIDTAQGYGDGRSERVIAQVLQERKQTHPGENIFVATKTPPAEGPWPPSPYCRWQDRYSAAYLRHNVHERLRNLGVERLDLLQLHTWTRAWNDDPQTAAGAQATARRRQDQLDRRQYTGARSELCDRSDAQRTGGRGAGDLQPV